ncbi:MAG: hypothetical protein KME05_10790 [Gloeocapsa sp. UFS-A4-WI-NPMV-4B04]|jgi:hypothetical protein|nr:hypothetical protein [Gloeocapsa sp. UFS-A4-WI-NPMV-4B04]
MLNQISAHRFLYENSVSYRGQLIIPFLLEKLEVAHIYSYTLLSDLGHKSQFHKVDNSAQVYSNSVLNIIELAKQHLEIYSDINSKLDYFKNRYTYYYNLIVIHEQGGKYFYDHYPPEQLNNIAAPKLFKSESDCINWVKKGLERNYVEQID